MLGNVPSFSLANFEGPLELLLYLIQKEEMDILEVMIKELTLQLTNSLMSKPEVDLGGDALSLTATLLLMKSQKLLPKIPEIEENTIEDPRFEMIQQLLEYSRFKEAAQALATREASQQSYFPRSAPPFLKTTSSGLEEVELQDLTQLLKEIAKRAEKNSKNVIQEDKWQVSTKITWLREYFMEEETLHFNTFFSDEKSRSELIVSFLAMLELMKIGEIKIVREESLIYIAKVFRS